MGLFDLMNPPNFHNPPRDNCSVGAAAVGVSFLPHSPIWVPDSDCKNRIVGAAAAFPPNPSTCSTNPAEQFSSKRQMPVEISGLIREQTYLGAEATDGPFRPYKSPRILFTISRATIVLWGAAAAAGSFLPHPSTHCSYPTEQRPRK